MLFTYDFKDGPMTERLLYAIQFQDPRIIANLYKEGKFRIFKTKDAVVTSKSLLPAYIADYVANSGYTLHDIFFGFGTEVNPKYSPHDKLILSLLDRIPDEELNRIYDCIQKMYPNSFYYFGQDLRPTQKLRAVVGRLPRGTLFAGNKAFNIPGGSHLSEEAQADLARFRKGHYTPKYVFDSNCIAEYAEFLGISLHWIWNLPTPLFCKSQIGDLIFDYYTMMQPYIQKEFISFLIFHLEEKERKIREDLDAVYQLLHNTEHTTAQKEGDT